MVTRLTALVSAFANINGALDPKSDAFQLQNPLMLKGFSPNHEKDEKGNRKFKTFVAGWDNGIIDLKIKCSGQSYYAKKGLGPTSPLCDLVCLYGNPTSATRTIVNFLRHALKDDTIPQSINLGWFLEDQNSQTLEVSNGI
jgi:hypothetical protein